MFLLVPAYPGCPGSKAVKRSLLLLLSYCYLIHFCNTFDDNNRSVSWKRATAIFGIMCLQDTGKQCLHQSALTSHWVMLLISANRTEFAHISESVDVNFGLINIHTFCFIHFGLAFIRSYSHSNGD